MDKGFAKGALFGALAGAIAGILFAPKAGEETREDLKNTFNEIKEKVTDKIKEAGDFTREIYDKAVHSVVSSYQEASKITPSDAEKIRKIFDESFSQIQEIVKKDIKNIKDAGK